MVIFKAAAYGWSFNYMDLDPTYKDMFGDPLLRVTNQVTDHDRRLEEFGGEKMGADIVETEDTTDV